MSNVTNITELSFIGHPERRTPPKRIVLLPDGYQKIGETYQQAVQRRANEHDAIIAKLNAKRAAKAKGKS